MAEQPPSATPSTQKLLVNESPIYGRGVWISYKVDTQTRLRSSLRSIARFLRIMSQPSDEPLDEFKSLKEQSTGFDHVEGFCTFLSNLYKSSATCSIDRHRWKTNRIYTFKSIHGVEHECLVVAVICGRVGVHLRIERRIHKVGMGRLFNAGKPSKATTKDQTSDDSATSPDNATYPHDTTRPTANGSTFKLASDEITYSKDIECVVSSDREEQVDLIEFPEGKGLSLPQIAVLACCVNSMGRAYHLVDENCYWFAHIMVETAKLIETDFTVLEATSKRRPGSWSGLLTTKKPTREMVNQAKAEYDKQWKAFNDDIHDTINNKNSKIYLEERRKREEAERFAAEKEKQEKEERCKREEAERLEKEERCRREEAEQEIERLRAQLAAAQAANGAK
ncbi:hypothetical protein JOM56_003049 [Amanita muscaria]